MELFTIKNLTFTYPEREKPALNDVSFDVESGEILCVCGKSGCGKSTLLRHLKPCLTPHGKSSGSIQFSHNTITDISERDQAQRIGYVLQNPDNQIVTDKVWHELAFGLESLGYDKETIRLRVAEMASFFGIENWFYKNVTELSGGQKQLLNLASIMAMQPEVLILDEPTAQLDPIAAGDFLQTVAKINREIGTTIIITEHRMEDVFPMSDRVLVMDNGKVMLQDTPRIVGRELQNLGHDMVLSMPTAMQLFAKIKSEYPCPLTVREGRQWLEKIAKNKEITTRKKTDNKIHNKKAVIEMKDVWFRYSREGKDVVAGLSMKLYEGELFCLLGGNGTGKTTTLSLISTLNKPYRGKIYVQGKELYKIKREELFQECLAILPQNPQSLFVKKTVREDLKEMFSGKKISKDEKEKLINEMAIKTEISHLLDMHPYDLSGGEQQRVGLAKVMLLNPKILLLDEPTKGMDNCFKKKFGNIIKNLQSEGVSILMVSHDVEFCATYGNRCGLFFNGDIVTQGSRHEFFCGNNFYTTVANRISRNVFENAVLLEEVVELCLQNNL